MNKIGIHYGSFVRNWNDEQFSLIPKVKELGFDVLEFGAGYLLNMSDNDIGRFKDLAAENGIDLVMSLGLAPNEDIGSPDTGIRNAGKKILTDLAIAMRKVGASDCSGIIHGSWNGKINDYSEKQVYWKNSVEVMKEASKAFADEGVHFNVEVVNRFENFLINTCDEAIKYLDEVDSPQLGIHLDTFHMNIEESNMVSPILKAKDKLRYFHIGENNRNFPGLGSMPWKTIFETLKLVNYQNPISMEPFVKPGGEVGSAVSLYHEIMQIDDYDSQIRQSLEFVKNLLV